MGVAFLISSHTSRTEGNKDSAIYNIKSKETLILRLEETKLYGHGNQAQKQA